MLNEEGWKINTAECLRWGGDFVSLSQLEDTFTRCKKIFKQA